MTSQASRTQLKSSRAPLYFLGEELRPEGLLREIHAALADGVLLVPLRLVPAGEALVPVDDAPVVDPHVPALEPPDPVGILRVRCVDLPAVLDERGEGRHEMVLVVALL